jgi:hypothetical protein
MTLSEKKKLAKFVMAEYFQSMYGNFDGVPTDRLGAAHVYAKKKVLDRLILQSI